MTIPSTIDNKSIEQKKKIMTKIIPSGLHVYRIHVSCKFIHPVALRHPSMRRIFEIQSRRDYTFIEFMFRENSSTPSCGQASMRGKFEIIVLNNHYFSFLELFCKKIEENRIYIKKNLYVANENKIYMRFSL
jgi:hypothetical protein